MRKSHGGNLDSSGHGVCTGAHGVCTGAYGVCTGNISPISQCLCIALFRYKKCVPSICVWWGVFVNPFASAIVSVMRLRSQSHILILSRLP